MRCIVLALSALVLLASVAIPAVPPSVKLTIVTDFRGPRSTAAMNQMQLELARIMGTTGLILDWKAKEQATSSSFDNLVVIRFNGKCTLEPVGLVYDERGPLAFTHTSDGEVLPFTEVECDKVTATVRSAMVGRDYSRADALFGRALGRIVAHELVHILSKTMGHSQEGVAKASLSGKQLVAERLSLTDADFQLLQSTLFREP